MTCPTCMTLYLHVLESDTVNEAIAASLEGVARLVRQRGLQRGRPEAGGTADSKGDQARSSSSTTLDLFASSSEEPASRDAIREKPGILPDGTLSPEVPWPGDYDQ